MPISIHFTRTAWNLCGTSPLMIRNSRHLNLICKTTGASLFGVLFVNLRVGIQDSWNRLEIWISEQLVCCNAIPQTFTALNIIYLYLPQRKETTGCDMCHHQRVPCQGSTHVWSKHDKTKVLKLRTKLLASTTFWDMWFFHCFFHSADDLFFCLQWLAWCGVVVMMLSSQDLALFLPCVHWCSSTRSSPIYVWSPHHYTITGKSLSKMNWFTPHASTKLFSGCFYSQLGGRWII